MDNVQKLFDLQTKIAEQLGISADSSFQDELAAKLRSGEATLTDDLVLWQTLYSRLTTCPDCGHPWERHRWDGTIGRPSRCHHREVGPKPQVCPCTNSRSEVR